MEFEIFPNPAKSNLFVKFSVPLENVKVSIHNVLGQLVYDNSLQSMQPINIEAWSKRLYVLQIYNNSKKSMTFKLIKE